MTLKQRVIALRRSAHTEAGFTIFELVAAVSLSAIVSLATISILITVTANVGQSQANTAIAAQTESAMTTFTRNIRGASTFEAFSRQGVVFVTENGSNCERHNYQFVGDESNAGKMALRHQVTAVQIPVGATCESISDRLRSGTVEALNDSTELRSLAPSSHFRIYASTGQELPTIGSPVYLAETDLPTCRVTAIEIVIDNALTTSRGASVIQENTARAALINNVRGLTC